MVVDVKRIFGFALLGLSLASCSSRVDSAVYWETLSVVRTENGVEADIVYPYRFGGVDSISEKMNVKINEAIAYPMLPSLDAEETLSVDSIVTMVIQEKLSDSVLSKLPYSLNVKGYVHELSDITSVFLSSYVYQGGANGNVYATFLNFDNNSGNLLDIMDVIEFDEALLTELRKQFCLDREVAYGATAEQAGMFVSPSELEYSREIGFNSAGVVFYYNLYEIAPRSFGKTEVVIPYDRVKFKN